MTIRLDLRPEEISNIIKNQIKNYENKTEEAETGTVIIAGDGIVRAFGLDNCMANELVQFEGGQYGMAMNLEENTVSIVMLDSDEEIKERLTELQYQVTQENYTEEPFNNEYWDTFE